MGFNINEHQTNIVPFQSGSGVPSHLSPLGSVYVDNLTGIEYINKDGLNTWSFIYDSTMSIGNGIFLPLSGGSLTGPLSGTSISATTYYGDGSHLSGIVGTIFTGGTVTGSTQFTNGLTANTISATTYLNLPLDIRTTGGTYSNNTFTFTNNTGGTYSLLFNILTGLTINGVLSATTISGGTFYGNGSGLTNFTSGQITTALGYTPYNSTNPSGYITGYTDTYSTGGTYSNGIINIKNNLGNSFNIEGLYTGTTDFYVPYSGANNDVHLGTREIYTGKLWLYDEAEGESGSLHYADEALHFENSEGETLIYIEPGFVQLHNGQNIQSNLFTTLLTQIRNHYLPDRDGTIALTANTLSGYGITDAYPLNSNPRGYLTAYTDTYTTGGTYSNGSAVFTNNSGGTFTVNGFTTPFTGGTVAGATQFTNGLTANTISATTYLNLPLDIRTTGGTYSNGTAIFTNNSGGTFNINGFTLPFTGGTVTGSTNYINGLTANTISATTYLNLPSSINIGNSDLTLTGNRNLNTQSGYTLTINPATTFTKTVTLNGNISSTAWGVNGINLQTSAATYTDTSSTGTVTNNMVNTFGIPTIATTNTGVTYTNASTLYIAGAPITSNTGITITNPTALSIGSGKFVMNSPTTNATFAASQIVVASSSGSTGGFFMDLTGSFPNAGLRAGFGFTNSTNGNPCPWISTNGGTQSAMYLNGYASVQVYGFTSGFGFIANGQTSSLTIASGRIHSTGIYSLPVAGVGAALYTNTVLTASQNNQTAASIYINDTFSNGSFSGLTQYGIYQNNTAFNYLQGNTGVNTNVDAGYKLDVNGTTRLNGKNTFTGSITASANLAQANLVTSTLVTAANNDVLVGLDVVPTFSNPSGYTGVTNYSARFGGDTYFTYAANRTISVEKNITTGTGAALTIQAGTAFSNGGGGTLNLYQGAGVGGLGVGSVNIGATTGPMGNPALIKLNGGTRVTSGGGYVGTMFAVNNTSSDMLSFYYDQVNGIVANIYFSSWQGQFTSANSYVFDNNVGIGQLTNPAAPTLTPSATGGTLTAATYYYKIVAVDVNGKTTGNGTEANTTTTGTTSSVGLTWTAIIGAYSYRIYQGTVTNTQTKYFTSTTNSATDIGSGYTVTAIPNVSANTSAKSWINGSGLVIPSLTTTNVNAWSNPITGQRVYDNTLNLNKFYNSTAWDTLGSLAATQTWSGVNTFSSATPLILTNSSGATLNFAGSANNSGTHSIKFSIGGGNLSYVNSITNTATGSFGNMYMDFNVGNGPNNTVTNLIRLDPFYNNTTIVNTYLRGQTIIGNTTNNMSAILYFQNFSLTNNASLGASGIQSVATGSYSQATRLEFLVSISQNPTVVTGDRAMSIFHATKNILIGNGTTDDGVNTLQVTGSVKATQFNSTATQTTLSGSTSGNAVFSMPFQGSSYKKVMINCNSLVGATSTYTFPTAFTTSPSISVTYGVGGSISVLPTVITTLTNSTVIITGTNSSGILILEGY